MINKYIKSDNSIKKINLGIIISLIPLILFGFYKNGIKLFYLNYVNIFGLFKPLILTITGFFIGLAASYIYDKYVKKNNVNLFKDALNTFYPIYGLLIASIISINTNYFIFFSLTFIILFISKFIKNNINLVAITFLLILIIMHFTTGFTFLNLYESSTLLHLEPIDYFLGLGSGGVCTTSTILLIISFIILCTISYYKKEIAIVSIFTYIICIFLYGIFKSDLKLVLESIFSNGLLFNFIYIAPLSMFSPCTNKGKIIYSILVGVITFLLYLIKPELASIGAIFILSLSSQLIDKLAER